MVIKNIGLEYNDDFENKKFEEKNIYKKINAWVLAIAPILEAYALSSSFPLTLSLICVALAFLNLFVHEGFTLSFSNHMSYMVIYPIILCLISLSAFITTSASSSLIFSIIATISGAFCIWFIWHYMDFEYFIKCAEKVAFVCIVVAIVQVVAINVGGEVPTGEIPFLYRTTSWTTSTYGFRINSLFSEPSYLAIYILPLLAYEFDNEHYFRMMAFVITLVMSSSSLGIIVMLAILVIFIYKKKKYVNLYTKVLFFLFVIILMHMILYNLFPYYTQAFDRTINKISEIFQGDKSDNVRLTGYIQYYSTLPLKNMIFGVGLFQLSNYFSSIGLHIDNYGNTYVYSLMSHGFICFCFMIFTHIRLFLDSYEIHKIAFWLVFILISAIDGWELSYKYYYVLTFIVVPFLKREGF